MLPDRGSNPGPLTYESGALPIALRGPANIFKYYQSTNMTTQGRGGSAGLTFLTQLYIAWIPAVTHTYLCVVTISCRVMCVRLMFSQNI